MNYYKKQEPKKISREVERTEEKIQYLDLRELFSFLDFEFNQGNPVMFEVLKGFN